MVHRSPDLLTNMERLCSVSCADVASRNLGCADVTADDICCADVIYKATGIVLTSMKRLGLSVLTSYKTVGLCWHHTRRLGYAASAGVVLDGRGQVVLVLNMNLHSQLATHEQQSFALITDTALASSQTPL